MGMYSNFELFSMLTGNLKNSADYSLRGIYLQIQDDIKNYTADYPQVIQWIEGERYGEKVKDMWKAMREANEK